MSAPKKLRGPKGRVAYAIGLAGKIRSVHFIKPRLFSWAVDDGRRIVPVAVIPASSAKAARDIVKAHNYSDPGVGALARSCEALKGCKNRRELNATISFIVDYFITHPSKELPAHLNPNALGLKGR